MSYTFFNRDAFKRVDHSHWWVRLVFDMIAERCEIEMMYVSKLDKFYAKWTKTFNETAVVELNCSRAVIYELILESSVTADIGRMVTNGLNGEGGPLVGLELWIEQTRKSNEGLQAKEDYKAAMVRFEERGYKIEQCMNSYHNSMGTLDTLNRRVDNMRSKRHKDPDTDRKYRIQIQDTLEFIDAFQIDAESSRESYERAIQTDRRERHNFKNTVADIRRRFDNFQEDRLFAMFQNIQQFITWMQMLDTNRDRRQLHLTKVQDMIASVNTRREVLEWDLEFVEKKPYPVFQEYKRKAILDSKHEVARTDVEKMGEEMLAEKISTNDLSRSRSMNRQGGPSRNPQTALTNTQLDRSAVDSEGENIERETYRFENRNKDSKSSNASKSGQQEQSIKRPSPRKNTEQDRKSLDVEGEITEIEISQCTGYQPSIISKSKPRQPITNIQADWQDTSYEPSAYKLEKKVAAVEYTHVEKMVTDDSSNDRIRIEQTEQSSKIQAVGNSSKLDHRVVDLEREVTDAEKPHLEKAMFDGASGSTSRKMQRGLSAKPMASRQSTGRNRERTSKPPRVMNTNDVKSDKRVKNITEKPQERSENKAEEMMQSDLTDDEEPMFKEATKQRATDKEKPSINRPVIAPVQGEDVTSYCKDDKDTTKQSPERRKKPKRTTVTLVEAMKPNDTEERTDPSTSNAFKQAKKRSVSTEKVKNNRTDKMKNKTLEDEQVEDVSSFDLTTDVTSTSESTYATRVAKPKKMADVKHETEVTGKPPKSPCKVPGKVQDIKKPKDFIEKQKESSKTKAVETDSGEDISAISELSLGEEITIPSKRKLLLPPKEIEKKQPKSVKKNDCKPPPPADDKNTRPSEEEKQANDLDSMDIGKRAHVRVIALDDHVGVTKAELTFKMGQTIKQKKAANSQGMAYGYVVNGRVGIKRMGYYPVSKVVLKVETQKSKETKPKKRNRKDKTKKNKKDEEDEIQVERVFEKNKLADDHDGAIELKSKKGKVAEKPSKTSVLKTNTSDEEDLTRSKNKAGKKGKTSSDETDTEKIPKPKMAFVDPSESDDSKKSKSNKQKKSKSKQENTNEKKKPILSFFRRLFKRH